MKKNLLLLTSFILTLCVVGFAIYQLAPASPVSAASEVHTAAFSATPVEKVSTPAAPAAQPVIYLVTGLVCALFGILAVAPLFLGDSNR